MAPIWDGATSTAIQVDADPICSFTRLILVFRLCQGKSANLRRRLRAASKPDCGAVRATMAASNRTGAGAKWMSDEWEADVCFIRPDQTAAQTVERQQASRSYAFVVIGAGVRLLQQRLAIFEAAINAVHKATPDAAIAAEPKANPPRRVAPRMSDFITCLPRENAVDEHAHLATALALDAQEPRREGPQRLGQRLRSRWQRVGAIAALVAARDRPGLNSHPSDQKSAS